MVDGRAELNATASPPFDGVLPRGPLSRTSRALLVAVLALCVVLLAVSLWWRARAAAVFIVTRDPSLAVLPFATIGVGADYLADGVTQALTTELGKVHGIQVIASKNGVRLP